MCCRLWRQVFGRHGGWHEGGEYVAVGIGQAIHTLPAMWRTATGEDLFASEPGIRGFLDFLVYRTRPDRTHMRWGDGAWFDRHPRDTAALALEYRHAAAYSLAPPQRLVARARRPQGGPVPTGWPWGPLSDDSLIDPTAPTRCRCRGSSTASACWSRAATGAEDATWVSFKAGDNYWSHSHLDQGAFTIFKGAPLAIDSGWYGPAYGSEHHMNYTYQSIAHNLVTVTDPADNQPGPGFDAANPAPLPQRRRPAPHRLGLGRGWRATRPHPVAGAPRDLPHRAHRRPARRGRPVGGGGRPHPRLHQQPVRPRQLRRPHAAGRAHVARCSATTTSTMRWSCSTTSSPPRPNSASAGCCIAIDAPVLGDRRFDLFIPANERPGRGGGPPARPCAAARAGGPAQRRRSRLRVLRRTGKNYDEGGRHPGRHRRAAPRPRRTRRLAHRADAGARGEGRTSSWS